MVESPPEKSTHTLSRLSCLLYVLLAVILGCGAIYLLIYLNFNWEYIRSDFTASQAQPQVEQIYNQIIEFTPNGISIAGEEEPQSGTYAWGLSDGAPRYAYVRAQQSYATTLAFSDVLALYTEKFMEWGWVTVPMSGETTLISTAFRRSDDEYLIVGLCSPSEALLPTDQQQFTVFFDFDETVGCEGQDGRLGCVAARYCGH